MNILKWIKLKITQKSEERKRKKEFEKRLEELRKRDPFIYNH